MPGKDNAKIYVCYGKVPTDLIDVPIKMNWHVLITGFLTVFLHVAFGIFQILFRRYDQKKYQEFEKYKSKFGKGHNSEDMFVYLAAIVGTCTLTLGIINVSVLDVISPDLLDTYPYYIMVYVLDEIQPVFVIAITLFTFLLKHSKFRREVWQEIRSVFP